VGDKTHHRIYNIANIHYGTKIVRGQDSSPNLFIILLPEVALGLSERGGEGGEGGEGG
jgi:hypothetical protein